MRAAQSVTLSWNPSIATNVAGYKIYYGTTTQSLTNKMVVGNVTNASISGLVDGRTYYFAATTYDGAGDESTLSSQASYVVPVTPVTLGAAVHVGQQFKFNVAGVSGYQYVVQISSNLVNWISVLTNTAPFTYTDSAATGPKRFYRTQYLQQ